MFIYNFNEKGLDKFETDVNEAIKIQVRLI